ncbi:MAG TPA: enoyl-ACP reductase [Acidiferrobacteraceae bacterium]|nr:enoyl-ACP reductase [Acidiferrobacteraceae bacterium]HEX20218.1 enoyl-ACP reductase [Acidiferrobacteraceae bacterium]
MAFLKGKRALIVGAASERSIAWGIAKAMHREGAEIAFAYQTEKLRSRIEKMASLVNSDIMLECDVSRDEDITKLFDDLKNYWEHLDIIIHSVAFAKREELSGDYVEATTREGFQMAHDISSYSFVALAKAGRDMMQGRNGALLTLSYIGAVRAMPNYNIMGLAKASLEANVRFMADALGADGIRVNAISAGPIRTLAAAGIGDFRKIFDHYVLTAPLRRGVSIEEVGNAAAFLCSDLASGITGEITYVDGGFNAVAGIPGPNA